MEATLHEIAHYVALAIESVAVAVIALGAIEAVFGLARVGLRSADPDRDRRAVWLHFARWLVAGLTFQLAADIINTSFGPTWEEVALLGAVAAIRTFLSYFLDREMRERDEIQEPARDSHSRQPR